MKVREVISIREWDDNGWGETQVVSDEIIEGIEINESFTDSELESVMDWSWLIPEEPVEDEEVNTDSDVKVTIQYYAADDEYMEKPLYEYEGWKSDIVRKIIVGEITRY